MRARERSLEWWICMVRLLAIEGRNLEQRPRNAPFDIPESVRDVISRRLAHLSGECNRMLVRA